MSVTTNCKPAYESTVVTYAIIAFPVIKNEQ